MELTGDLSDFALTDILQILALSRKTGTLALESAGLSGRIVIERGRITQATMIPGDTLADRLLRERLLGRGEWEKLKEVAAADKGVWTLSSLITESGFMSLKDIEEVAQRHIREIVGVLVALEKGRFSIALNQVGYGEMLCDIRLAEGLDVSEVLLGVAKESDESWMGAEFGVSGLTGFRFDGSPSQNASIESDNIWNDLGNGSGGDSGRGWLKDLGIVSDVGLRGRMRSLGEERQINGGHGERGEMAFASMLCSLLVELRSYSFEAEVSLLVMRYASEVATRGVLFVVKENEICGLGQFGIENGADGRSADEKVREISIPLGAESIFNDVVLTGDPYIGFLPEGYWHSEFLAKLGATGLLLSVFVLPIICHSKTTFLVYGDNHPGTSGIVGLGELVALVNQASVVLEKIVLERELLSLMTSR